MNTSNHSDSLNTNSPSSSRKHTHSHHKHHEHSTHSSKHHSTPISSETSYLLSSAISSKPPVQNSLTSSAIKEELLSVLDDLEQEFSGFETSTSQIPERGSSPATCAYDPEQGGSSDSDCASPRISTSASLDNIAIISPHSPEISTIKTTNNILRSSSCSNTSVIVHTASADTFVKSTSPPPSETSPHLLIPSPRSAINTSSFSAPDNGACKLSSPRSSQLSESFPLKPTEQNQQKLKILLPRTFSPAITISRSKSPTSEIQSSVEPRNRSASSPQTPTDRPVPSSEKENPHNVVPLLQLPNTSSSSGARSPRLISKETSPRIIYQTDIDSKFNLVYNMLAFGDNLQKSAVRFIRFFPLTCKVLRFLTQNTKDAAAVRDLVFNKGVQPLIALLCGFDEVVI